MESSEEKLKHLEFIQNVITRMNTASFKIKGWAITTTTAIFGVLISTKQSEFALLGIAATILFWALDAYYLMQERRFRELYNAVAGITDKPDNLKDFQMNPHYKEKDCRFWSSIFSTTLQIIYLSIVCVSILAYFYFSCKYASK